ncbi:hypothetical protein [Nocardia anaemiae]|uniref:hypothetical protein n=1 Tax=Nocardia anaemiae TaxID=263910 RepID=UPI0007A3FD4B|nr:hypothetical protein [Nocardia anaemiae]
MVTLGVSTERGAVHAVAIADGGEKLPERVLLQRVVKTRGDSKADLAVAVQTALDTLAAELESEREIVGAAVAYRDAVERRAIVTKLASGPWHTASLVSAKSAHLSVAGVMTWLDEFDDLLICEVVPGHQAFTLIDRKRSRVLAATSQSGSVTAEALDVAVSDAWDQFEAAMVRPDAVVLIGSAADGPVVATAMDGFGAPVLPCKVATSASAVGAALFAMSDATGVSEPVERVRSARGHTAMFAAASVLAGGLVVGGLYVTTRTGAVVADARVTADARVVDGDTGSASGSAAGSSVQPNISPFDRPEARQPTAAGSTSDSTVVDLGDYPQYTFQHWGAQPPGMTSPDAHENEAAGSQPPLPGTGVPGPTTKVGAPNGAMLFPGEAPPPAAFTPESYHWWENHFRMLAQWAAQQLLPT